MSKGAVNFEPLNPLVTLPLSGARVIYEPSVYLGDGTQYVYPPQQSPVRIGERLYLLEY